ncbi:hypothetical protein CVU82_02455 [Candidatus Falkowbacteria bacterium HGW-Falkowbacteria-1]|uniref:DUF4012 domain-containing protein n=1 Tax=Candidatus Falkowbacteria bacterium HGW-Falkowbacteria-1 TaxID=2013768 RepID=A0A2N2E9L2_9BACT|nr:MAG: hypothetical protein CVU82_02455 [Candidatus Falkowbacteria bacterium HGW-Falkowbacteria-1]
MCLQDLASIFRSIKVIIFMAFIKKHNIKVFSEDYSSDFVVDLRSGVNNSKQDTKNKKDLFRENNKERESDFSHNFLSRRKGRAIKIIKFNKNKFERTLFYPFWLFLFKIAKSIYCFFFDWIVDIIKFLNRIKIFRFFKRVILFPFFVIFNIFKSTAVFIVKFFSFKIKLPRIKFKRLFKKNKNHKIVNFDYLKTKQLPLFRPKKGKRIKSFLLFFLFLLFLASIFKIINYYNLYKGSGLKDDLMNYSMAGVESFSSGSKAVSVFDFYKAYNKFSEAGENFKIVDQELKKVDELLIFLSFFSNNQEVKALSQSKNISKVGLYLSSLGNDLTLSFNSLFSFFADKNNKSDFADFSFYIKKSFNDLKKTNSYLNKINIAAVPDSYSSDFVYLKDNFKILEKNFSNFVNSLDALRDFLGVDSDKRYLLVFQNNSEMRASGGFIGSYAIIDIKNGKIDKVEIPAGGSYDTQGGMKTLIESPKPLHLVKPLWYFWDANWWPDWKVSAQNLMWFYEKSGGSSVDGVISFTPEVLEDLLSVLGEVDLSEKYGVVINSENFQDILQEVVEFIGNPELYGTEKPQNDLLAENDEGEDYLYSESSLSNSANANLVENDFDLYQFEQNKPKEIIGDLFDVLLERLTSDIDNEKLLSVFELLVNDLNKKNILLYFQNDDLQKFVEDYSWAGRVKETSCDYLMIVDTNIAGGKSDRFLEKNYSLLTEIKEDGSVVNKLRIERDRSDEEWSMFSGLRNVDWLRVYVPLGSKLIKAYGFSRPDEKYFKNSEIYFEKNEIVENGENKAEIDLSSGLRIYQELDKTVFANWTMTDLGQLSVIEIEYELPYNVFFQSDSASSIFQNIFSSKDNINKHCLLWQSQPGSNNASFNYSFYNNSGFPLVWAYPKSDSDNSEVSKYGGGFDADEYFSFILK